MGTATTYRHIVKEDGEPARLESHPRTRVAMIVIDYLARGLGPEEIVRHYSYLKLAEVHSAMAYFYDHEDEIRSEIQAELDLLDRTPNANSNTVVLRKLRASGLI